MTRAKFSLPSVATVLFAGILAACASSNSDDPKVEERLLYAGFTSGLWVVDPAHPTVPVNVALTEDLPFPLMEPTVDAASGAINGSRRAAVAYLGADGYFYRLGGLTTDSLTPSQIASERGMELTEPRCQPASLARVVDSADYLQSAIFYQRSSPDASGSCSPTGPTKLIRVGMSPADAPITVPYEPIRYVSSDFGDVSAFDPIRSRRGGITGWLALDGSNVIRCDATFTICQSAASFVRSVRLLPTTVYSSPSGVLPDVGVVQIDGQLYTFDTDTGTLSPSRHTFSTDDCSGFGRCRFVILDQEYGYIGDGTDIWRFRIADGSEAVPFLSGEQGSVNIWFLTADRVLYILESGTPSTFTVKSVSKTGGAATTIIPPRDNRPSAIYYARGRIYYQQGTVRAMVNEDGTGRVEQPDSAWAGFIGNRLVWIDGCASDSCGGGTLIAGESGYSARAETVLGTVPSDAFGIFFHGNSLGMGSEIFYADVRRRNSLVQVTNTPLEFEIVL